MFICNIYKSGACVTELLNCRPEIVGHICMEGIIMKDVSYVYHLDTNWIEMCKQPK